MLSKAMNRITNRRRNGGIRTINLLLLEVDSSSQEDDPAAAPRRAVIG